MDIGAINLSVDFGETYSEVFHKTNTHIVMMTIDNFENKISECDGVIICEDTEQDAAYTCSILLKIKERTTAPVWVFSSNLQKVMRFIYLELGALGVITRDYEADELRLVICNTLNKHTTNYFCEARQLKLNTEIDSNEKVLQLMPINRSVKINGKEIPLTRLEYKVMESLYIHRNNVVTYRELFESIWSKEFNNKNHQVANLVFHLREKIEGDSSNPVLIRTVRSEGYMLNLKFTLQC